MYKILLADNEGVVLDSLSHMIHQKFGEDCDIRMAQTADHTRALARRFLPDIAVINIQMPGMHGFDIIREIRALHSPCMFITVVSSDKPYLKLEAENRRVLAHLTKPLSRDKILPPITKAAEIVAQAQKRRAQAHLIREKFRTAIPYLENDLINQMFFPDTFPAALPHYQELLGFTGEYGLLLELQFQEAAPASDDPASAGALPPRNPVGSAIYLHRDYLKFRGVLKEQLPDCIVGPVMADRVFVLLPCAQANESGSLREDLSDSLARIAAALAKLLPGLQFQIRAGEPRPLAELRLPL